MSRKIIAFGTHVLVHVGASNNMKPRSVPGIALRRSNNAGGHYFMSLLFGKMMHGCNWDDLPIDKNVIEIVESMGEEKGQLLMRDGAPILSGCQGMQ